MNTYWSILIPSYVYFVSLPVDKKKPPHTMTWPPLCLTVQILSLGWWKVLVFLHTLCFAWSQKAQFSSHLTRLPHVNYVPSHIIFWHLVSVYHMKSKTTLSFKAALCQRKKKCNENDTVAFWIHFSCAKQLITLLSNSHFSVLIWKYRA